MEAPAAPRYTPREEFSVVNLVRAMLGSALLAFPLGVGFGWFNAYVPIYYFRLPIAMLFSAILGRTVLALVRRVDVRHQGAATAAALTSVLTGLMGSWLGERWVRLHQAVSRGLVEGPIRFFVPPADFWDFVRSSFREPSADLTGFSFLGPPLALVWFGEAVLIAIIATAVLRRNLGGIPYCEGCDRWTVLTKGVRFLIPDGRAELVRKLSEGHARAILAVVPSVDEAPGSLRVDIAQCDGCLDSVYLSLSEVPKISGIPQFLWPPGPPMVCQLKISAEDSRELRQSPKLSQFAPPHPGSGTRQKK